MARGNLLPVLLFLLLPSCVSSARHFETYAPQFEPNATARFTVGQVIDATDRKMWGNLPSDAFSPASELKSQLETTLATKGLAAPADAPDAIVLRPTISEYGSSLSIPVVSPATSDTELFVKCDVLQHGENVGTIRIRRGFAAFGIVSLLTIGEWRDIYKGISGDIVDALLRKIGKNS